MMKKERKKAPFWLKILAVGMWSIAILLIIFLYFYTTSLDSYEIDQNGTELHGEFTQYDNKVYVAVPSNGMYLIPEADLATFHAVSDEYYDRHIGLDKNNVYAGNLILPDLNPKTTQPIGGSCYTDGTTTYYVAFSSERNKALENKPLTEMWQSMRHTMFDAKKPQTYWYPFKKLPPSDTPYRPLPTLERFVPAVTNGTQVYYSGEEVPQANPNTLVQLDTHYSDGDTRKSMWYFADGENVYFHNKKLPLKDNGKLYSVYLDNQRDEHYLLNPLDGMVYYKDIAFDRSHAPYSLLSPYGGHAYQSLFLSKEGVYFWDSATEKVQRAGDNPFLNKNFTEIAPLVFSDGEHTLFVEGHEHWAKKGHKSGFKGLLSRSTYIYELTENLTGKWEKIGDVNNTFGEVWKNGNTYFYFDKLGNNQLMFYTIYKIADAATREILLHTDPNTSAIRKLVENEQLQKVERKEILRAKTRYNYDRDYRLVRWLGAFVIFVAVMFGTWRKWKQRKKD